MKIVVSYLSSKHDNKTTIDLINKTDASGIHVDLTDGLYAGVKNFDINTLPSIFADNSLPLDVHLMVKNPSNYLNVLKSMNVDCIYIHPDTESGVISILKEIQEYKIKAGIAIKVDEDINKYEHLYPYVDRVLLMSVPIGFGGSKFFDKTKERLDELKNYQNNNSFEIFIDGGINPDTIKIVSSADGVVCGSYICQSNDYNVSIKVLRDSLN